MRIIVSWRILALLPFFFLVACASNNPVKLVEYSTDQCVAFASYVESVRNSRQIIKAVQNYSNLARLLFRRQLEEQMNERLTKCIGSYKNQLIPNKNDQSLYLLTKLSENISLGLLKVEYDWKEVISKVASDAEKRALTQKIAHCGDEALLVSNILFDSSATAPISEYLSVKAYQACVR